MTKMNDVPVVVVLNLSLVALSVIATAIEEYYIGMGQEERLDWNELVMEKAELTDVLDGVTAKEVLEAMKNYGTTTNMAGIISALKEIDNATDDIAEHELIQLNFKTLMESD